MGFFINGKQIDLTDAQSIEDAGISFGGSIVAGNSYGVTGGTVEGDVYPGQQDDNDK